ncbi:MAG: serine/threonine-protein kinase [Isosphaeraceae bacterium]
MASVPSKPTLEGLDYRVVKPLGEGAGSTILLIADTKLGTRYALKIIRRQGPDDDIYVKQAQHEFDVAQRLRHRCLLKIHDIRIKKSWLKVTGVEELMEYVDGRTLDDIAMKDDVGQLVLIFNQVAAGLAHMHRRGIYHGDLKPSNILLSRAGEVKIIDFGTAWIKGEFKDRVQGTVQYMAPEQATEKVVNERTDLYNFGATMYRLLTGEYANLGIPQPLEGGIGGLGRLRPPIDFNPKIPGTLSEAVMACLRTSPDRRPAGVFEVRHQIVASARYLGLKEDDLRGSEGDDDA